MSEVTYSIVPVTGTRVAQWSRDSGVHKERSTWVVDKNNKEVEYDEKNPDHVLYHRKNEHVKDDIELNILKVNTKEQIEKGEVLKTIAQIGEK